jgi:hypothetical protein
MPTFDVEGTIVHCQQREAKRVWSCSCDYFRKRAKRVDMQGSGGYCPHIALAVVRAIQEGTVDPTDPAASDFEVFIKRVGNLAAEKPG